MKDYSKIIYAGLFRYAENVICKYRSGFRSVKLLLCRYFHLHQDRPLTRLVNTTWETLIYWNSVR